PEESVRQRLIARFDPCFPATGRELNADLCQLLVYLEEPDITAKTMKMIDEAPTQEEQVEYAKSLRVLKTGWTPALRKQYFEWYLKAAHFRGGASLRGFLRIMKNDAVATLMPQEKEALRPVLEAKPFVSTTTSSKTRPTVKHWTVSQLDATVGRGLHGRDFD